MSQQITLEHVSLKTVPPEAPLYSTHGYCITEDGTTYTLLHQWHHGVVLALLFPEKFAAFKYAEDDITYGYVWPADATEQTEPEYQRLERPSWPPAFARDRINVRHFQDFELDLHGSLPVIRVCPSRMSTEPSIDVPRYAKVTDKQLEALQLMGRTLGYGRKTLVHADNADMKWPTFLQWCSTRTPDEPPPADDEGAVA